MEKNSFLISSTDYDKTYSKIIVSFKRFIDFLKLSRYHFGFTLNSEFWVLFYISLRG